MERPPTSATGRGNRAACDGFTLFEVICVMAIIAIVAAVLLPAIPRGTSRASLQAYSLEIAALLNSDRNAAVRRRTELNTTIDVEGRTVRSASSDRLVRLPADVRFEALLAERCNGRLAGPTIRFFDTGMSCGGVLALVRPGTGYEIRVNWLTGGVEVVTRTAL